MPSILIVEDDSTLRALVATLFRRKRFDVFEAPSAADMHQVLADEKIDLILLDVRLPDSDGFDLLRDLRRNSEIPIVMITGLDTPVDRVLGLEFGADDYVCKPFEPRELVARVKSVLRRTSSAAPSEVRSDTVVIYSFEGFRLDVTHRSLQDSNGNEIELTSGEFDLLTALVEAANRPLSRDQLLDRTRSREWSPFDRSVDVLIGRIRKKIEPDAAKPKLIKTVRTVGYVLTARVEKSTKGPPVLESQPTGTDKYF